jgi:hypothetical protein
LEELLANSAPGSIGAALSAPAAKWIAARCAGASHAVMQQQQLAKTPGASVFFTSSL